VYRWYVDPSGEVTSGQFGEHDTARRR
jgi:hypothetical protein